MNSYDVLIEYEIPSFRCGHCGINLYTMNLLRFMPERVNGTISLCLLHVDSRLQSCPNSGKTFEIKLENTITPIAAKEVLL